MGEKTYDLMLTAPQGDALLAAVHRVRIPLDGDLEAVRRLTRALAVVAGLPPQARSWPEFAPLPREGICAEVISAIAEKRLLRIEHLQQHGELRELVLEPYHVRLERGWWYLIARLADSGKERVMRMDKLMSVEMGDTFEPRPVDLERYADGVFVPEQGTALARVTFGPRSAAYATQRWAEVAENPAGEVVVEIPYQREHWLVRTIAESGDDFTVLAPESLRAAVHARAAATLAIYEEPA